MSDTKELLKIIEVLKIIDDTFLKMADLTKGEFKSTSSAQVKCYDVIRGNLPRDKMTDVMDELSIAKNTIERMNYILGFPLESDLVKDIKTAWWNANVIRTCEYEFKEYQV